MGLPLRHLCAEFLDALGVVSPTFQCLAFSPHTVGRRCIFVQDFRALGGLGSEWTGDLPELTRVGSGHERHVAPRSECRKATARSVFCSLAIRLSETMSEQLFAIEHPIEPAIARPLVPPTDRFYLRFKFQGDRITFIVKRSGIRAPCLSIPSFEGIFVRSIRSGPSAYLAKGRPPRMRVVE